MNENQIKRISIISLVIGTFLSYLSLLVKKETIILLIGFLIGFFGIAGLIHITRPNNKE